MFWKCFFGVILKVILLEAFVVVEELVIDKSELVPEGFGDIDVDLSNEHPEVMPGLYEGDIVMNNEEYEELKLGLNFGKFPEKRWPNKTVPYVISSLYSTTDVITINLAIRALNSLSCLKFKPRKNQKDYILIWPMKYPEGCFSSIGRRGGVQVLSLKGTDKPGPTCLSNEGTPIHELMHAAGIYHEQSRGDREKFIEIIYENIIPSFKNNFQMHAKENTTYPYEYDYDSIMHYGSNYFAIDPKKPTIVPKMKGVKRLGQRKGLSKTDCFKLNSLYGCFSDEKLAKKYSARCLALTIN